MNGIGMFQGASDWLVNTTIPVNTSLMDCEIMLYAGPVALGPNATAVANLGPISNAERIGLYGIGGQQLGGYMILAQNFTIPLSFVYPYTNISLFNVSLPLWANGSFEMVQIVVVRDDGGKPADVSSGENFMDMIGSYETNMSEIGNTSRWIDFELESEGPPTVLTPGETYWIMVVVQNQRGGQYPDGFLWWNRSTSDTYAPGHVMGASGGEGGFGNWEYNGSNDMLFKINVQNCTLPSNITIDIGADGVIESNLTKITNSVYGMYGFYYPVTGTLGNMTTFNDGFTKPLGNAMFNFTNISVHTDSAGVLFMVTSLSTVLPASKSLLIDKNDTWGEIPIIYHELIVEGELWITYNLSVAPSGDVVEEDEAVPTIIVTGSNSGEMYILDTTVRGVIDPMDEEEEDPQSGAYYIGLYGSGHLNITSSDVWGGVIILGGNPNLNMTPDSLLGPPSGRGMALAINDTAENVTLAINRVTLRGGGENSYVFPVVYIGGENSRVNISSLTLLQSDPRSGMGVVVACSGEVRLDNIVANVSDYVIYVMDPAEFGYPLTGNIADVIITDSALHNNGGDEYGVIGVSDNIPSFNLKISRSELVVENAEDAELIKVGENTTVDIQISNSNLSSYGNGLVFGDYEAWTAVVNLTNVNVSVRQDFLRAENAGDLTMYIDPSVIGSTGEGEDDASLFDIKNTTGMVVITSVWLEGNDTIFSISDGSNMSVVLTNSTVRGANTMMSVYNQSGPNAAYANFIISDCDFVATNFVGVKTPALIWVWSGSSADVYLTDEVTLNNGSIVTVYNRATAQVDVVNCVLSTGGATDSPINALFGATVLSASLDLNIENSDITALMNMIVGATYGATATAVVTCSTITSANAMFGAWFDGDVTLVASGSNFLKTGIGGGPTDALMASFSTNSLNATITACNLTSTTAVISIYNATGYLNIYGSDLFTTGMGASVIQLNYDATATIVVGQSTLRANGSSSSAIKSGSGGPTEPRSMSSVTVTNSVLNATQTAITMFNVSSMMSITGSTLHANSTGAWAVFYAMWSNITAYILNTTMIATSGDGINVINSTVDLVATGTDISKDTVGYNIEIYTAAKLSLFNPTMFDATDVKYNDAVSSINVSWYLSVLVQTIYGTPVQGARVNVSDVNSIQTYTGLTAANGLVTNVITTEWWNVSGVYSYRSPHNITAQLGSALNFTQRTVNGQLGVVLTMPGPQYSTTIYPSSGATYAPGATYWFNFTWNAPAGINNVTFEWNGVNGTYTVFNVGAVYYVKALALSAGNYTYKCYANDTNGVWGVAGGSYSVTKADPGLTLLLNGTAANLNITNGTEVNITAILGIDGTVIIYLDGTAIGNGTSLASLLRTFTQAGTYNITAYFAGNENYTAATVTLYITVVEAGAEPPPEEDDGNMLLIIIIIGGAGAAIMIALYFMKFKG